jgi:hypothetical protein
VLRRLGEFIGRSGAAAEQVAAITPTLRNHALDAVGIGVFTALRSDEAISHVDLVASYVEPPNTIGACPRSRR